MGSKRKKWEQVCGKRRSVFAEALSVAAWYHDADMGAAVFAGPDRKWRNLRHVSHAFFHGDKGRTDTTRPEAHDGGQTAVVTHRQGPLCVEKCDTNDGELNRHEDPQEVVGSLEERPSW